MINFVLLTLLRNHVWRTLNDGIDHVLELTYCVLKLWWLQPPTIVFKFIVLTWTMNIVMIVSAATHFSKM